MGVAPTSLDKIVYSLLFRRLHDYCTRQGDVGRLVSNCLANCSRKCMGRSAPHAGRVEIAGRTVCNAEAGFRAAGALSRVGDAEPPKNPCLEGHAWEPNIANRTRKDSVHTVCPSVRASGPRSGYLERIPSSILRTSGPTSRRRSRSDFSAFALMMRCKPGEASLSPRRYADISKGVLSAANSSLANE